MAQTFFNLGMFAPATFSLFIRNYPPHRGYFVFAGLEDVLDYLSNLSFSSTSLDYLLSTGIFSKDFLDYLGKARFTGSVRAMPEGSLFFANEPALEVTGPIIEAQLAETFIVNQINLQTLLTTKAARCVWAAQGRIPDRLRIPPHPGSGRGAEDGPLQLHWRFQSTSNVLAAQTYRIPPAGTMAHSFVSSFPSEAAAFQAYAQTFPDRTVLLLDTYDTIKGAYKAVDVAKELEADGHRLLAVRLDSGDFDFLSREVRRILDEAGLQYVKILPAAVLMKTRCRAYLAAAHPSTYSAWGRKVGVSPMLPGRTWRIS